MDDGAPSLEANLKALFERMEARADIERSTFLLPQRLYDELAKPEHGGYREWLGVKLVDAPYPATPEYIQAIERAADLPWTTEEQAETDPAIGAMADAGQARVNKWIFTLPVSCCVLADADGRQCQCERAVAERAYERTWKARRQRAKWRVRVWIENRRERLGEIIAGRRFDDLDD